MRTIVGTIIAASLLVVCAGQAQPGGEDARAIVEKSIEAIGGTANLAKLNAQTWSEKGTYYGMGEGLPYTGKSSLQWPSQFRMEILDVFTIVLDGDKGWVRSMGETKEMTQQQLAVQRADHRAGYVTTLLPLRDKAFTLKTLPAVKVDGKIADVVQVSRKDYPDVKLYFDKKTKHLVKSEHRSKAADLDFKEMTMEFYYSDYRAVSGAKVPHKLVMKRDGKLFVEAEMTDIVAAGKLDAKIFARPE